MKVVYFHRRRPGGAYSIEKIFNEIRSALPKYVSFSVMELSFLSQGFLRRLYISIEAALNQGDINHITGDVHFIALFLKKRRTVLTIHDLGFMNHPNPVARYILKWFWIRLPVERSKAVTVISEATKAELMRYIPAKYAPRIHVIYNPISKLFSPDIKFFNENEPIILQIGTKYNKNLSRLIKALSGIRCKLKVIGDLSPSILSELKFHQITYEVFSNLSDEQMVMKYKEADIVSFVSTLEGFGLPILEANATGRVVITSNISSMPEIAGTAAHLVDPFDVNSIRNGFLKVIQDTDYREKLVLNGFKNCKRFDVRKIADQYTFVYKSLINHN